MDSHAPHLILEVLAYAVGARLYWASRDPAAVPSRVSDRLFLLGGAVCGAALGSKALYVAQYASVLATQPALTWLAGKTVVGGLLGGWLGVEVAKLAIGWPHSTGDRFVLPFAIAVMIGRIGCQLSGPWDLTYGTPTSLPWGWHYGDGIPRHPVAAYEVLGLAVVTAAVFLRPVAPHPGTRFRRFVAAYLLLRFGLEFLKPPHGAPIAGALAADLRAGLTAIQWTCAAGVLWCLASLRRRSLPAPVTA
ncbi:MAG: prolipoprotein diacylglyceryl transferase family protein [Burkholderiales bacterium]